MLKRMATLFAAVVALLAVSVFPAGAAWGAPVPGGTLTSGTPVNGSVSTADGISYTFTAVAGKHFTLAITAPHVAVAGTRLQMNVYNSSNAQDKGGVVFNTAVTEIDLTPTAAQAGTTTVVISPYDAGAKGTFTLTYALDVTGSLTSGTPVNIALTHGGQNARYTFSAVQGKHVTLSVTNPLVDPPENRLQLDVYNSSGASVVGAMVFSTAAGEVDLTPTASGVLSVVISPYDFEATGSFTLTYAVDVAGALTSGTPVTGTLNYAGQRTAYTFTAVAGHHVTLALTNPHVDPAGTRLQMNVYDASGAADVGAAVFSTARTELDFTPTPAQAGTTTVVISPYDVETIGSFTLTYATDLTGALTSGKAVAANLTHAGQQTAYTFTAVTGKTVTVAISSPLIDPAGQRMQLNAYSASGAADTGAAVFSTSPTSITFTPTAAQAGTTSVVVSKYDGGTTGRFNVTYTAG